MVDKPPSTLRDIVKQVGPYPEDAFIFIREGLSFAAERVHGPETEAHRVLQSHMAEHDLDWENLTAQHEAKTLPPQLAEIIETVGGCEKLNRHVSGREFCWALKDYALQRWGRLARLVLDSWHIKGTADFGRIVFGLIEYDLMRKRAEDSLEDFKNVYDFREVFTDTFPEPTAKNDQSQVADA